MNFSRLIGAVKYVYFRILWICEAISCVKVSKKASLFKGVEYETLIIVPHADDEWVGCSQIIRQGKGIHVLYMDFPKIHGDKNACIRYEELLKCSCEQNFELHLCDDWRCLLEKLEDIITNCYIKQLFVPSFWDWHPDHIEAIRIVWQHLMTKRGYMIDQYCYQISCPILSSQDMFYLRVKRKWKKFGVYYRSQKNLPIFRFRLHEVLNGIFYKVGIVPIEVYKKVNLLELEENNLNAKEVLRESINDIALIRKESETYFRNV